jgi:hypothetical protein
MINTKANVAFALMAAVACVVSCSSSSKTGFVDNGSTTTAVGVTTSPTPGTSRTPCTERSSDALVQRFVSDFNRGNIDGVEALVLPQGGGFRFFSTQRWGVEMDRTRVAPILKAFHDAGERIEGVRMGATERAGVDGIGGTYIRYGVNGAIKFQIRCDVQRIAAIAWDLVDQPALRR